jgi:hypothetical protein
MANLKPPFHLRERHDKILIEHPTLWSGLCLKRHRPDTLWGLAAVAAYTQAGLPVNERIWDDIIDHVKNRVGVCLLVHAGQKQHRVWLPVEILRRLIDYL